MDQMTHWERIRAVLKGQPTDRLAVSTWRHFYALEQSPETLAEAMLAYQRKYDWDFMKINPRASYHMEGWGLTTQYNNGNPPRTTFRPVEKPEDWLTLEVLKTDSGVLKEQLDAIEMISKGLKGDVPFIMTAFTPASIASRLTGSVEDFIEHLRLHYDEVSYALDVILETFTNFIKECVERKVSGFFVPITAWANNRISEAEYKELARPYDLKLLDAVKGAEFSMLHVCGNHNLMGVVKDYPVHSFNWDARGAGNPSLAEGKTLIGDKVAVGGIACIMQKRHLIDMSPQQIASEVTGLRAAMGHTGWILSPGCVYSRHTPEANVEAIRHSVD